ncbi:MAG: FAD-dependent oxidoreductase [Thermoguttaceae bacterium]
MDYLSQGSYWHRGSVSAAADIFPALGEDRRVDVAIVGAGITGLTAAYHLKRAGKSVAVLEAGRVGAGTTGGTSGHLEIVPDQSWVTLVQDFGEDAARKVTVFRQQAIVQIESWARELAIPCDLRRIKGVAFTERTDGVDRLRQEYETASSLGVAASFSQSADLPFRTVASVEFPNQGRFHSQAYLRALARQVHGGCGAIYEHTRALPPEDGAVCVVQANGCRVEADSVVIATHSSYLGISQFDMRQAPYQSYVLTARVAEEVPDGLYWDDEDPYHYIRRATSNDPRLLVVGGADHKTGQSSPEEHAAELAEYVAGHFRVEGIEDRWSAEFFEPADGLPMIGRVPATRHLYVATGYSGTGLTYGTAAGNILARLILAGECPDGDVFSPSRLKPMAAAKALVTENLNAAGHFLGDRFGVETVDSLDSLGSGQGRVVKYRGETCAAYRDGQGQLHLLSPVCTHAGCIVQWNGVEHTWDCPCHGGRYSPRGERLYGPPSADLDHKEPD